MAAADDDNDRLARFTLALPKKPATDDVLRLAFDFLDIHIRIQWPDSQRHELVKLVDHVEDLIEKCHLEYEVVREAEEIDGDLGKLFDKGTE